jgi:hypothetical protein
MAEFKPTFGSQERIVSFYQVDGRKAMKQFLIENSFDIFF